MSELVECLGPKQAQLLPYTVVLYDKGGTIQRAGCLHCLRVLVHIVRLERSSTRSYGLTLQVNVNLPFAYQNFYQESN